MSSDATTRPSQQLPERPQTAPRDTDTPVRKLTGWAAIIAVPTAVTGFYGQNVPYPGFQQSWGFVTSVLLMLVIGGGLYLGFKRKNWV